MIGVTQRLISTLLLTLVLWGGDASAQGGPRTISGEVRMGTPGANLPSVEVVLVAPAMGMEEVATEKTVDGRFSFQNIPPGPPVYLVQVEYQGVTYRRPADLSSGPASVDIEVYEATDRWEGVKVEMRQLVLRTDGNTFRIDKTYQVHNRTPQRRTVAREGGAFQLHLPAARVAETTISVRAQGQPVTREPIATGDPERFTVDYPIRPGTTEIHVAYHLPYSDKRLHFEEPLLYDLPRVDAFIQPADVEVEPQPPLRLVEVNREKDLIYLHGGEVAAGVRLAIDLSGGTAVGGGRGRFQVVVEHNRTQELLPYVVLIIGAILAVTAILTGGRRATGAEEIASSNDKEATRLRENLVTSIAALDDRLAAGTINRRQYERRRSELMRKLEGVAGQPSRATG